MPNAVPLRAVEFADGLHISTKHSEVAAQGWIDPNPERVIPHTDYKKSWLESLDADAPECVLGIEGSECRLDGVGRSPHLRRQSPHLHKQDRSRREADEPEPPEEDYDPVAAS